MGIYDDLFDLDGDGKATAEEEFISYQIMQESMKDGGEEKYNIGHKKELFTEEEKRLMKEMYEVPDEVNSLNYKSTKSNLKCELISWIINMIVMLILPAIAIHIFMPEKNADVNENFLNILLVVIAVAFGAFTIYECLKKIIEIIRKFITLNSKYKEFQENQKNSNT